jgi:hypothetical protein
MAGAGDIQGKEHKVKMGLGEAILRLVHVESLYANNLDVPDDLLKERELIVEALNQHSQLDLGFDCDGDGIPDTVEIFEKSAKESCCRILPIHLSGGRRKGARTPSRRKSRR